MSELREKYKKEIEKKLEEEFGIKNIFAVPTLKKIVVNAGIGSEYKTNTSVVDEMVTTMEAITGQKPVIINSKTAISNFKLRENTPNGVKVTLRGDRMWDFFSKLVNTTLPRIKDFRGVSRKSLDGKGSYTMGIREHTIFPEIDTSTFVKIRSIQVVINTSAKNNEQTIRLLELLGMPFERLKTRK
ncbi:MAG: 50S ribosomal protein L5 [Candidatus Dojkabacteria bacterium]